MLNYSFKIYDDTCPFRVSAIQSRTICELRNIFAGINLAVGEAGGGGGVKGGRGEVGPSIGFIDPQGAYSRAPQAPPTGYSSRAMWVF